MRNWLMNSDGTDNHEFKLRIIAVKGSCKEYTKAHVSLEDFVVFWVFK